MAKHYIIIDELGRVLRGFSGDFEQPNVGAICINEDSGRHFELNGVINPPMTDYNGVPFYKFDGDEVVKRTQEELDADKPVATPAITTPSIDDRTSALESALLELILGGIV
jgi:hypothetical protein